MKTRAGQAVARVARAAAWAVRAGARAGRALWRRLPVWGRATAAGLAALAALYLAIPLPRPLFPDDYSLVVTDRHGEILRVFLNQEQQWCFAPDPAETVSDKLQTATVLYEDEGFYRHPGVNPRAVVRALRDNWRRRRVVSGASTLTMQVARLMRPKPRTWPNKLLESLQALKLETRRSKSEILRLYLDHAPYGANIRGCRAAAYRYFGKSAAQLTWAEAATLAVLPNAPGLVTPVVRRERLIAKRDALLASLRRRGFLSDADLALALRETAPERIRPFPLLAPHAADGLRARGGGPRIVTTLDRDLQAQCRDILARQMRFLRRAGIGNACALIAETRTGEVRAYVGSQDYFDDARQGRIDGVRAPRSSASILKPFLFALAIGDGLLLPDTLLRDVPTVYRDFTPRNYDDQYSGLVSAREALVRSLNVPAVRLLDEYGLGRFYWFLKSAGVGTLFRQPEEYGLPLILGGAEVTLWDVAALFRGLGGLGRFAPLSLTPPPAGAREPGERLLDPAAAYLTLEMLRNLKRPGAEFYWEQYQDQYPLAWKTGTSYGARDAWAAGVSPQWTIAVWVGNFRGEGNANLTGASCAGPILFDLFNILPKTAKYDWFARPAGRFVSGRLCPETGYLAGDACPRPRAAELPAIAGAYTRCPYHRIFHLSRDRRHTVCSLCWGRVGHVEEARLVYPPHVMQFLREHGQLVTRIPPHEPSCPAAGTESLLEIAYPQAGARIWIPRGLAGEPQRVLAQVSHRDRDRLVYWYVDGLYVGETRRKHEWPLLLSTGTHRLEVVDEFGHRAQREFQTAVRE